MSFTARIEGAHSDRAASASKKDGLAAPLPSIGGHTLLAEVRELILRARAGVARAVDTGLTSLYWHVGHRVRQNILKQKRAEYGGQIVSALGRQLEMEFVRGFSEKSLRHMIRFAETFPDFQIVSALLRQLSWTDNEVESLFLPVKGTHVGLRAPVERGASDQFSPLCPKGEWPECPSLRASDEHILIVRVPRARRMVW